MPPEVATLDKSAVSPSGKYLLVVQKQDDDGVETFNFQLLDKNNSVLFTSPDKFSAQDTTYFLWDADDRVWVYSGDVGTFFWQNEGDPTIWPKYVYAENNVPAPQFLKDVRPRWHQK